MAIQIDWPSKSVTVDQSDCTLVSGTFYTIDTDIIWLAIIALEDDPEGMPWPHVLNNAPPVTIAGTTLARSLAMVNGYTIEFLPDSQWTVQLEASNNNFWSVGDGILVQNQVQVIPTNAAGLVHGIAMQQDTELTRKMLTNKQVLSDGSSANLVTYDDDNVTVLLTQDVSDESDGAISLTAGDPAKRSKGV